MLIFCNSSNKFDLFFINLCTAPSMGSIYQAIVGVYWFVVYLNYDISPNIDNNLLVTDQNLNLLPIYDIAYNSKLYILLETPKIDHKVLVLYINSNITKDVLIHNTTPMINTDKNNFNIYTYLKNKDPEKPPSKNIENVIANISDRFPLPDYAKNKFLEKYMVPQHLIMHKEWRNPPIIYKEKKESFVFAKWQIINVHSKFFVVLMLLILIYVILMMTALVMVPLLQSIYISK
nr:hypothetical protein [Abalone asfa-like virus]